MILNDELLQLLRCPVTGDVLERRGDHLQAHNGEHQYPLVNGIPWVLPNARNSLLDWGAKLNHFQQVLRSEIAQLERELKNAPDYTRDRLTRMHTAKKAFVDGVIELIKPVVSTRVAEKSLYDSLRDRAPSTQNLLSYEANLYRDWVWGEEENRASAELVTRLLDGGKPQRLLVLGAGSCRLACDLHTALQPQATVATDINPLLLMAADRIFSGEDFKLYEFPLQPRDMGHIAVEQSFKGLAAWPENFHLAFADVANSPFEAQAFDAVVTPWLIDIQPHELGKFLANLNQYLPVGGQWINFGSLVFNQRRDAYCYTVDEVREVAAENGFAIDKPTETETPYLKSPHNVGYRVERIWSWRAEKTADVEAQESPQVLPEWLLDIRQPIPRTRYFQAFAQQQRVHAELASEVNGKTSIKAIAGRLAKQNRMDADQAAEMVRNFFLDIYRQNNTSA
jgi:uncharacterized protein YbaR (Trm112 family)